MRRVPILLSVLAVTATSLVAAPAGADPRAPAAVAPESVAPWQETLYPGYGDQPVVAVAPTGSAVAAWERFDAQTGESKVVIATRELGGPWFGPTTIATMAAPSPDDGTVRAGISDTGEFVTAWQDSGTLWAARGVIPVLIAEGMTGTLDASADLAVAADGTALLVYVALHTSQGVTETTVQARVTRLNGASWVWSPPVILDTAPSGGMITSVAVGMDRRTGDAVAAWGVQSASNAGGPASPVARVYRKAANTWAPPQSLGSPGPMARLFDVAAASTEASGLRASVVWQEDVAVEWRRTYRVRAAGYSGTTWTVAGAQHLWQAPPDANSDFFAEPRTGIWVTGTTATAVAAWMFDNSSAGGSQLRAAVSANGQWTPASRSFFDLARTPDFAITAGFDLGVAPDGTAMVAFADTGTSTATRTMTTAAAGGFRWRAAVPALSESEYLGNVCISVGGVNIAVTCASDSARILLGAQDPPEPSRVRTLTVRSKIVPGPPRRIRLTASWQPPSFRGNSAIDRYVVTFRWGKAQPRTVTVPASQTTAELAGPISPVWRVSVVAVNANGESSAPVVKTS